MSVIDAQIAKLDSDRLEWTSACPLSHLILDAELPCFFAAASRWRCSYSRTAHSGLSATSIPYGRAAVMSRGRRRRPGR